MKRARRSQLPGLTAKGDQRKFVEHNYVDHVHEGGDEDCDATDSDLFLQRYHQYTSNGKGTSKKKPGPFPLKLHIMLSDIEREGLSHIISWLPHGRAFAIHKPNLFEKEIMAQYFKQSKITSFHRQLNLYGFRRLTQGRDNGGYYNEYFLRGKPLLTRRMIRTKVKGTKIRAASSPEDEPDFYSMIPSNANVRGRAGQPASTPVSVSGGALPPSRDQGTPGSQETTKQAISSHSAAQGLIGLSCQGNNFSRSSSSMTPKNPPGNHLNVSGHSIQQGLGLGNNGLVPSPSAAQRRPPIPASMTVGGAGQFNQGSSHDQGVLLALLRNQQQQQQLNAGLLNSSQLQDGRNDQLSLLLSNLMNPTGGGLQHQPSHLAHHQQSLSSVPGAGLSSSLSNFSQMLGGQSSFGGASASLQSQLHDLLAMRSGRHHHALTAGGDGLGVGSSSLFAHQTAQGTGRFPLSLSPSIQGASSLSAGPLSNARDEELQMLLLQMQLQKMNQGRVNNMSS